MPTGDLAEIGKYRIISQIGEGAMGVVYRGIDPVLNRPVAIKVMNDAVARDKELRARFLREAQSAGSLQHPNVVTVYDFGEVDGHPFIAMELVEGADLDELLRRNAPLTLVEKIDIVIDVLNGLSYAHKRGIVHRDIKPANIRIDEEGRARIMDFGIAHLHTAGATRMTRTGVMVGTPAYMSPEQITGSPITPASDIFSTGAVMYELFVGATAFQADTLQSIMYQIVTVPAPEMTVIVPAPTGPEAARVIKALDAVVARAMAKEAGDRFATAMDMSTALSDVRARVVEGQSTAGPASLRASVAKAMAALPEATPPRPAPKRRFAIAAGASLVAAAVVIAIVVTRRDSSSVTTMRTVPPPVAPAPTSTLPPAAPATPAPVSIATGAASAPRPTPAATTDSKPSATNVTSARELSLIRDLQTTALDARRRAVDAGASAVALDSGDAHNRMAGSLMAEGKPSEAGAHLRQASAAWSTAERVARAASASSTANGANANNTPRVSDAAKSQSNPPIATVPAANVSQQSIPAATIAQPTQPPAAPANPSADINAAVASYARALESRDVATVRRAYPGITAAQAKGWQEFFPTLRSLRVTLTVSGVDVNGSAADAKVVGTYDYITEAGKTLQQPVSFQATLRREGGAWQLASIR
jgi:serine/threonine protein kinase